MFSAPSIESLTPVRQASGPIAPVVGDWAIMETRFESPHTQVARCIPVQSETADRCEYLIKMPRWDVQSSEVACRIIRREAKLLNGFDHPNLISVLDADLENTLPFFIMPNVGQWTVRDWIGAPGSVSIHDALWLARQASVALQYLHRNGWCHLDIKPENIVVNELGHVTLIDLAFATSYRVRGKDPVPLSGTAHYIAPERRVRGWSVSPAADVYSIGHVLTELLLGIEPSTIQAGDAGEGRSRATTAMPRESATTNQTLTSTGKLRRSDRNILLRSFYPNLPSDFLEFLDRMTATVPERRPMIDELVEAFFRWEIALWQP